MLRQALIRPAASLRAPLRTAVAAQRWQSSGSVSVPTESSATPPSHAYASGEEIDPQLDGYPQLPRIMSEHRSPRGWWDVQDRRNFGETLHEDDDVLGMWGPDPQPLDGWTALWRVGLMLSAIAATFAIAYPFRPRQEAVPKSFPYGGLHRELGGRDLRARDEANDPEVEVRYSHH